MFRKVIFPPESEASCQEMKYDCEKRMENAFRTIIVLGLLLIVAVLIKLIDPTMFGTLGARFLAGIFAVMIVQGVSWLFERQQLKKLIKCEGRYSRAPQLDVG